MDFKLRGKRAFVSASTAGIGFAIARGLAAEGAEVIVNGRTAARVAHAVQAVKDGGLANAPVEGVVADLGSAAGCESVIQRFPRIDILINNLGIFEPKPFAQITDDDWLRFFETNVLSGIRLSRAYLPEMVQRGWGRVIFISSESGLHIPPEMVHYGMTKTAQLAVSRGLAESVAGSGVTINAVLPGPTKSEGVGKFVEDLAKTQKKTAAEVEKDFFEQMRPTSLIKRLASPEEVANMVVYLCSEQASATTGAALRVDGGVVRSIA
jgi:NAD(P)-dependent dehydrogenase (short-subunit alcohol dehydrogenase family)